jgi:hypothetical protein
VAVKVAVVLVAPTVTVAGTVNAATLLDSATVAPPVCDTVTVQVELPPVASDVGTHATPLTNACAPSEIAAVCVLPFSVAVIVAVWLLVIVPAVAVKVAVVLVAPTVTVAGTVNGATLLDSATVAPPVCDTVTVHVELPPVDRLVGTHATPLTTVATKEIDAVCVLPFSVAVMVAVWLLVIVPPVAAKVAVVLPAPTVTVAGTVNPATLLDSATVAPPVCVTVTVQVDLPPGPRLVGLHVNPLSVAAVTAPPAPVSDSEFPEASVPNALVTLIAVLATPDASVTPTTATTPFCIKLAFMPVSKQT